MTSLALQFHEAHKARIRRIEEAAARHLASKQIAVAAPAMPAMRSRVRRTYETAHRPAPYATLATRIIRAVASEFNITADELIGPSRKAKYIAPRFIAIALVLEMTNMSLPACGRKFGNRDHTSILNARKKAASMFAGEAFRNRVDQIKEALR